MHFVKMISIWTTFFNRMTLKRKDFLIYPITSLYPGFIDNTRLHRTLTIVQLRESRSTLINLIKCALTEAKKLCSSKFRLIFNRAFYSTRNYSVSKKDWIYSQANNFHLRNPLSLESILISGVNEILSPQNKSLEVDQTEGKSETICFGLRNSELILIRISERNRKYVFVGERNQTNSQGVGSNRVSFWRKSVLSLSHLRIRMDVWLSEIRYD